MRHGVLVDNKVLEPEMPHEENKAYSVPVLLSAIEDSHPSLLSADETLLACRAISGLPSTR